MDTHPLSTDSASHEVEPHPPRYWWLKRIGVVVAVFFVFLLCIRIWWGIESSRRLREAVERCRRAGEPVYLSDFNAAAAPDESNAAALLLQSAQLATFQPQVGFTVDDVVADPRRYWDRTVELRGFVSGEGSDPQAIDYGSNKKALALIRRSRRLERADWGIRFKTPMFATLLPQLSGQRRLAKLCCVAAVYHHLSHDDAASVESLRDGLHISRALQNRRSLLITHLVATAIVSSTVNTIEVIAPELRISREYIETSSAPWAGRGQVEALIDELLDTRQQVRAWRRAVHCERATQYDAMSSLANGSLSVRAVFRSRPAAQSIPERVVSLILAPIWRMDGISMLRFTTQVADAAEHPNVHRATQSYPGAMQGSGDTLVQRFSGMISSILVPSMTRALQMHYRSRAERRMAAIALAMRMYELDHGARPRSLEALVPDYLAAVPADPFDPDDGPIRYLPDAAKPLLYSVGLDGEDEGGAYQRAKTPSAAWNDFDMSFFLDGVRPAVNP